MPTSKEEIDSLLVSAREEWNRAEIVVKAAEQVLGQAIVPSIKEFRYAGRRLIDALSIISSGGDLDAAKDLLSDAIFNCHCARHDSIDVATAVIAENMKIVGEKLGYDHVIKAFPDFSKLRMKLIDIREKIRISRENRENRDAIYQSIHEVDMPHLAKLHDQFQASEEIMKRLAARERRLNVTRNGIAVGALVVGLTSCSINAIREKSHHTETPNPVITKAQ